MKPVKSLLDPAFRYVNSADTDLRKTFARIRRTQRREQQLTVARHGNAVVNVVPLQRPKSSSG